MIVFLLLAGVFVSYFYYREKRQHVYYSMRQKTRSGLSWAWLFGVLNCTLLSRTPTEQMEYNLTLFWSYQHAWENWENHAWDQIWLNIFLFLPFGLLLPLTFRGFRSFRSVGIFGLLLSLFIETGQVILHLGLGELDDILHNTTGIITGYGIYCLWFCRRKETLGFVLLIPVCLILVGLNLGYFIYKM